MSKDVEYTDEKAPNNGEQPPKGETIDLSFTGEVAIGILQSGKRSTVRFCGMVDGVETEIYIQLATSSLRKIGKDMLQFAISGMRK